MADEMSELQDELSLRLLSAPEVDLGVEAFLWALGEPGAMHEAPVTVAGPTRLAVVRGDPGGGGRRTTDTTDWVCSQIRRKRRMLPADTR